MIRPYKIKSIDFHVEDDFNNWHVLSAIHSELDQQYTNCIVMAHRVDDIPNIIRNDCGYYVKQFDAMEVDLSFISTATKVLSAA